MDIQVSSNFERLLFEVLGRDGAAVAETHAAVPGRGPRSVDADRWACCASSGVAAEHRRRADRRGHPSSCTSAPGCSSTRTPRSGSAPRPMLPADPAVPWCALATAHPAKFPDAVEAAIGVRPPLPERLADLFDRPERYDTVPADYATVRDAISAAIA